MIFIYAVERVRELSVADQEKYIDEKALRQSDVLIRQMQLQSSTCRVCQFPQPNHQLSLRFVRINFLNCEL